MYVLKCLTFVNVFFICVDVERMDISDIPVFHTKKE